MQFDIPGRGVVSFDNVVLDYNGTIAVDGRIIEEVAYRIRRLSKLVDIHILTSDTFGTAQAQCEQLGVHVDVFPSDNAAESKRAVVAGLSGGSCCIGNGFNDRLMFEEAALSIAVIEREGACAALLGCADVVVANAQDAFDILVKPNRLKATLRG